MTFLTACAWFFMTAGVFRLGLLISTHRTWSKRVNFLQQAQLNDHILPKIFRTSIVVIISSLWLIFG